MSLSVPCRSSKHRLGRLSPERGVVMVLVVEVGGGVRAITEEHGGRWEGCAEWALTLGRHCSPPF